MRVINLGVSSLMVLGGILSIIWQASNISGAGIGLSIIVIIVGIIRLRKSVREYKEAKASR